MHRDRKCIIVLLMIIALFIFVTFGKNTITLFSNDDENKYNNDLYVIENFEIEYDNNYFGDYLVLKVGESYRPKFAFEPLEISEFQKMMSYTNSNSECLKVDHSGVFTGIKTGTSSVIITSIKNSDLKREIKVKVVSDRNVLTFAYNILANDQVYGIGQIVKLDFNTTGIISLGDFEWTSSDPTVAYVEDGYVKALSMGETVITVKSFVDENCSASVNVKVRGFYNVDKVNKVLFDNIVKVDIVNYSFEKFIEYGASLGNIVTISSKTNQEEANTIFYEFDDNSMVKIISNSLNTISFECLKTGTIKLKAISSYFPDVYEEISFNVSNFDFMGSFELTSPSSNLFESISDKKVLNLEYGKIIPISISSDSKKVPSSDLLIESNDENIVHVIGDYIQAVNYGDAIITIRSKYSDEYSISFNVHVIENSDNEYAKVKLLQTINAKLNDKAFGIIDYDYNVLNSSDIVEFDIIYYPIYATNSSLINVYLTNDDLCDVKKAYIDGKLDVMVNFLKPGFTSLIIECVEDPNLSLQYDFEIVNKDEVNFSFNPVKLLERGQTGNCNVVLSDGLKGVDVSYTSSDPSIVSVGHAGEMVGLGYGKATITVYATDGVSSHTESFEVECVKEHSLYDALKTFKSVVKMDNKEISLSEKLMYIGDSFTIDVSFTPSNHPFGKYHEVKVEKPDILSVDKNNNKYTFNCLKSGTTKVIVYPYANPDFSIEYTVTIANIMPEFMFVSIPDKVMYVEDRYQFGYLVDWRATYSKVDVIIGDESIVEIVDDYLVIKNPGKTYVSFVIDDNDDNTVSYVQTLEIEAFEHSNGVKLERYGYGNFIVRIISQVLCALIIGILGSVIASYKPFKTSQIINDVLVMGILLIVLILCNVVRISITSLKYEKYDLLISVSSYLVGLVIGFIVNVIKKRKGDVNNA